MRVLMRANIICVFRLVECHNKHYSIEPFVNGPRILLLKLLLLLFYCFFILKYDTSSLIYLLIRDEMMMSHCARLKHTRGS